MVVGGSGGSGGRLFVVVVVATAMVWDVVCGSVVALVFVTADVYGR